jgi:hypothetical protein
MALSDQIDFPVFLSPEDDLPEFLWSIPEYNNSLSPLHRKMASRCHVLENWPFGIRRCGKSMYVNVTESKWFYAPILMVSL